MLLKRLDVTVQSFGWSDRAKVCQLPLIDYITLLVWFIMQLLEIHVSCSLTLGTQGKDPVLGNNL